MTVRVPKNTTSGGRIITTDFTIIISVDLDPEDLLDRARAQMGVTAATTLGWKLDTEPAKGDVHALENYSDVFSAVSTWLTKKISARKNTNPILVIYNVVCTLEFFLLELSDRMHYRTTKMRKVLQSTARRRP